MFIRSVNPQVIEYPFSQLNGLITPTERFYVRDHFPQPEVAVESWRLRVEGTVDRVLELSYDEILALPSKTVVSTLECAGNSRMFLTPPPAGVQWHLGGVGTAEWTGVPLVRVLELAGLRANSVDVILEGADSGEVDAELAPHPPGVVHFARSLTIEKALDENVLLVYKMNGHNLTKAHGFPLRAIVPGWYAMASVKWLSRIVVSDHRFDGYFQTVDYAYWEDESGEPVRKPIREMRVKAEIAKPEVDEKIAVNSDYEVFGACWSGECLIDKVEVTTDDGKHWQTAELLGEPLRNAWRLWKYNWHTPSVAGKTIIRARATDENGQVQPMAHNPNFESYVINLCMPIEVELCAAQGLPSLEERSRTK